MPDIWTPSDDLLAHDPIARQKLQTPFEPADLEAHGIKLFDIEDDEANEAAACIVLATLDSDDSDGDEPGECDDDDEIDDPADNENVAGDI
ncbi:MAG TPA: hypothetical protein VF526_12445 [Solirubrobacteraceae bacterium]|jgi:hypothetical protein